MDWYRDDFFRWVSAPDCQYCQGEMLYYSWAILLCLYYYCVVLKDVTIHLLLTFVADHFVAMKKFEKLCLLLLHI